MMAKGPMLQKGITIIYTHVNKTKIYQTKTKPIQRRMT